MLRARMMTYIVARVTADSNMATALDPTTQHFHTVVVQGRI